MNEEPVAVDGSKIRSDGWCCCREHDHDWFEWVLGIIICRNCGAQGEVIQ